MLHCDVFEIYATVLRCKHRLHHTCTVCWMQGEYQCTVSQGIYSLLGLETRLYIAHFIEHCRSKNHKNQRWECSFALFSWSHLEIFCLFVFVLVTKIQSCFSNCELLLKQSCLSTRLCIMRTSISTTIFVS